MQDVPEPGKGGEAGASGHASEARSLVRFADFVLDLDACRLERENGEPVALTHGEFSLLRVFVSRCGRVLSRETLLNEVSNRRFDPFDRSVDAAVRRLRRKIEPDPGEPRLIVTVPGEGYQFDARTSPVAKRPAVERPEPPAFPDGASARSAPSGSSERAAAGRAPRRRWLYVSACLSLLAALGVFWRVSRTPGPAHDAPPVVVVLPFDNLTGDSGKDYLCRSLTLEVATLLSAYPGLKVVSQSDQSSLAAARYVVGGGLHKLRDSLRVTASLYDAGSHAALWSRVFDGRDDDPERDDVPRRIYDSLAGFHGAIEQSEERMAWQRSSADLNAYDYYLRGVSLYSRSAPGEIAEARAVLRQGLERWPESVLLRLMLARTHVWEAMNETSRDPGPDIDEAWRLAAAASSAPSRSPFEIWLGHWLMAFLYQWRDNDFSRSIAEARGAAELAPYDASSRSDLSWVLANAGDADEAIGWARFALDHDPNGPSRYYANLAWAYFVARRERDGMDALGQRGDEFPILSAALHIRLGEVDEARALVARYVRSGGADTVQREDIVPLIEPIGTDYTEALRRAGMPEK